MKNTKEDILNVSLGLFLQNGFNEVTMQEIVEKTGMSKGAIYHYFKSKKQLFLEVIDKTLVSAVRIEYSKFSTDSLYQFYHDYLNHFYDYTKQFLTNSKNNISNDQRMNYTTLILDALKRFPQFHEKLIGSRQLELNAWENIVRTARAKGEINSHMDDVQIAEMFVYSADGVGITSIFLKWKSGKPRYTLTYLWDSFYELIKAD